MPRECTHNTFQVMTFLVNHKFSDTQFSTAGFAQKQKFGYHKKWHNSECIVSTDLGQVSKFSLVQYLKLFLWHPKDLVSRKNVLKGRRKRNFFFLYIRSFHFSCVRHNRENFWLVSIFFTWLFSNFTFFDKISSF